MWVAWVLACNGEKEPRDKPEQEQETTPETSLTSWTLPGTVPPTIDEEALGQGLQTAIGLALALDAAPVFDIYDQMMLYGDGYCPYLGSYGSTTYGGDTDFWYAQCDSQLGATYSGYAYHYLNTYYADSLYEGLYMSATVISPEGTLLTGQGSFERQQATYGNMNYDTINLDGFLEYDGEEIEGTWLGDGIRPSLYAERTRARNGSSASIYVDGQLAGMGAAVDTVDFVEVSLDSTSDCAEPEGVISLRMAAGDWYEVTFSGPEGDCDGCGSARWRGIEMGEVCGDFGPWMAGEVQ